MVVVDLLKCGSCHFNLALGSKSNIDIDAARGWLSFGGGCGTKSGNVGCCGGDFNNGNGGVDYPRASHVVDENPPKLIFPQIFPSNYSVQCSCPSFQLNPIISLQLLFSVATLPWHVEIEFPSLAKDSYNKEAR